MTSTTLLPLGGAISPQHMSRVLNIRANLLPPELTARRNARQMSLVVIVALVLVAGLLGTWYAHTRSEKGQADQELDRVSAQIIQAHKSQVQDGKGAAVKEQNETIAKQLKGLMAQDLPWAKLINEVRATGTDAGVEVSDITGSLTDAETVSAGLPSTTSASTVASLQITGTGADKKTIAGYVDALGDLPDLASPYLTSATEAEGGMSFTLSAQVSSTARCGRFTTTCKAEGK
jgi:hypothetical protein